MELGKILTNRLQDKIKPLEKEKEQELAKIIQGESCQAAKDEAIKELVEANLGLAIKIACDLHQRKYMSDGIDLSDFISEGFLGLMEAAKRYDVGQARFSWYSSFWVKMKIHRFSENCMKNIRKPCSVTQKIRKLRKLKEKNATRQEIVKELNLSNDHELTILELTHKLHFEDSLDKDYAGQDGTNFSLHDMIECPDLNPSQKLAQKEVYSEVFKLVRLLPERERFIIQNRFSENVLTLQEIGNELSLTKERVRQLESSALKKLKTLIRESDQ